MMIRIDIHETDGLNASDHTLHVNVPTGEAIGPLHGPRGVAVEGANWGRLTALLEDTAKTAAGARPTIQTITFKFHVA